ncbi:hypothetical protein [Acinetobacter haemolyticus]|uniref:hypothetical protein n=1 Tax=Acinetobacter haemolyticus TaxID=29430 RepID=UPI001331F40E|nr:hypothetical protein [Acinetobacter haemolyticus]QHI17194.1 hypothetical protein AhaeAN4_11685 [Acinetobacter haemolyticus]
MRSIVDLCNLALSHLAQGYVVNDLNERTPHANLCNTYYPICRQELLDDAHQWTFAVARVSLNVDAGYTVQTAYVLPSDMIKPFQLESGERFYIEGDHLFTNDSAPVLRYVRDVKDLARLPATFKVALSYLLASRIAGPLTQSTEKQAVMLQMYEAEKAKAIRSDLQQHRLEKRPDFVGSMIEAR